MDTMTCHFCDIADGRYRLPDVDEPLCSDDNFLAIPSLGSFIEGWTLIIPKLHQLSMKYLYTNAMFSIFVEKVIKVLNDHYGPVIVFEHGANHIGSITACGTDHAHLHIVPFSESLQPIFKASGMKWSMCHISEIAGISEENEYLFYSDLGTYQDWVDVIGYIHILERPRSQYFRRALAERAMRPEHYDYRSHPFIEKALTTESIKYFT